MKSCDEKKQYKNFREGNIELNKILQKILFSNLNTYWCKKHNCVHIGHNYRMKNETILKRQFNSIKNFVISSEEYFNPNELVGIEV
ncbi:MAG: hypothetical protein CL892_04780 [Dehalococcoidia bacterium]|nr:hypothetical protein [Dehalococcoidia bacterium]